MTDKVKKKELNTKDMDQIVGGNPKLSTRGKRLKGRRNITIEGNQPPKAEFLKELKKRG